MPAKNRTKVYSENSYYHLYNRGVEKRHIFLDQQDYGVFLSYLKDYLMPKDEAALLESITNPNSTMQEKEATIRLLRLNNFSGEISLVAYCLMPNHFHLLIKQRGRTSIDKFMNSLCTRYTMYFNKRYARVGFLYQGVYKAVLISTDEQLLHLTRYIHQQALRKKGQALQGMSQPSSYLHYVGTRKDSWVHADEVLIHFSKSLPSLSYEAFVTEDTDLEPIHAVLLE